MPQNLTVGGTVRQQLALSGTVTTAVAPHLTLVGTVRQQLALSGTVDTPSAPSGGQALTLAGTVGQQFIVSGDVVPQLTLFGVVQTGEPVVLSPTSLVLTADGVANTATVEISEQGYTGAYTAAVDQGLIAAALISGSTLTVAGIGIGIATVTVYDSYGQSAVVSVTVYGPLTAIETTPPNSAVGTFLVAKAGYTGSFSIQPSNGNTTLVSPMTARGPGPVPITVTPELAGSSELIRVTDQLGGEVDLVVSTAQADLGILVYTLLDAGGINPLPPLLRVDIYPASVQRITNAPVASGYTLVGGRVELDLLQSTDYIAVFSGAQAPRQPLAFTSPSSPTDTSALTLVVAPYTSPTLSQLGYARELANIYPTRWLGSPMNTTGAAWPLFAAIGSAFASVDLQGQMTLAGMRLTSCEGQQLESWAGDFLGDFPRFPAETDDHYRQRIIVSLQTPNCTLDAIRTKVQAYIDANPAAQQGTVLVFDLQSNPAAAAQVGIIDGDGKFCVVLPATFNRADAFFAGRSYAGFNSYVIPLDTLTIATDVDPNILSIVDRTKAAGFRPVYAQVES